MRTGFQKLVLFIDRYGRSESAPESTRPRKHGPAGLLIGSSAMVARMCFAVARFLFSRRLRSAIRYRILGAVASDVAEERPAVKNADRVHVIGYLRSETGLGESARSSVRGFEKVGIRTSLSEVPLPGYVPCAEALKDSGGLSDTAEINLVHLNPDGLLGRWPLVVEHLEGGYNIGYWVWETNRWPSHWKRAFDLVHEIWTPTTFSRDLIARHTEVPVTRIPHNVVPAVPAGVTRKSLGLPERGFLFLAMVDFRSLPDRKNPVAAIEAFSRSFGRNGGDAYFVLKAANTSFRPDVSARIEEFRRDNPAIIVVEGYLDRPVLNGLINCCDCFVSLHRSEGFGLPIAEAMYMGNPVIATGYSGNMDFMNEDNSLPVRYALVRMEQEIFPYPRGSEWAEPDIDHAAELMRRVTADESLRWEIGARAAEEIRRNFSPEVSGKLMAHRLNVIAKESVDTGA